MVTPFQDELLRIHRQLTGWKQRLPDEAEDDPSLGTTPPGRLRCGWGCVFNLWFLKNKHSQEETKDVRWPSFTRGFCWLAFLSSVDCLTMRGGKSSFDTKVVCDFKPDQLRAWNMTMYRMVVSSQDAISTQDAIEEWKTSINLRELRWPYLIFNRNLQLRLHWCFLIIGIPFHQGLACKTKSTNRLFKGWNTTWYIVFPVSSFDSEDPCGFLIYSLCSPLNSCLPCSKHQKVKRRMPVLCWRLKRHGKKSCSTCTRKCLQIGSAKVVGPATLFKEVFV